MVATKSKKGIMSIKTPSGKHIGYEVGTTMYYITQAPKGFYNLNVNTPVASRIISKHRAYSTALKKAKTLANKLR